MKYLQTNILQNPSFETVNPTNPYLPDKWWDSINSGIATFPYPTAGRSGNGIGINITSTGAAFWAQTITGISPSSTYTLTGYVSTTNVVGLGAFLEIDWFDASNVYISGSASTSSLLTGTNGWTSLTVNSVAPPNAAWSNVIGFLNGIGSAIFDDFSFSTTTPPPPIDNYGCYNRQCLPGYGNLPAGCNNTCTSVNNYGCINGQCLQGYGILPIGCNNLCTTPPPITGCVNCDLTKNYCVVGQCIPKSYVLYSGVALGALLLLSLLKK